MRIREAKPIDVCAMGYIQAEANKTDTIVHYFNRDIDKYQTSYRRSSTRFCQNRSSIPGSVPYVAETEPSDYIESEAHKAPEVVGFVIWVRMGTSPKAKEWQARNEGWMKSFNRALVAIEDKYISMFPTVNCTFKIPLFAQILPYLSVPFDSEVFAEAWEVDLLFVHPDWQRKGVGRKLLQWGFDRATEEEVPVVVKSSARGVRAYRSYGFRSMGECGLDELFDTKALGGESPQFLVWEPEGHRDEWFERGKEALRRAQNERGINLGMKIEDIPVPTVTL